MPLPFAMPRAVQGLFDELTAEGFEPQLELTSTGDINLWIEEGRVMASGTFRRRKSGYDLVSGVLTIDGLVCPTATSASKLRRICNEPDKHLKAKSGSDVQDVAVKKAETAESVDIPPRGEKVTSEGAMPPMVLEHLREITKGNALPPGEVAVEKISSKRWHIRVDFTDGGALVLIIALTGGLPKLAFVMVNRPGDRAFDLGDTFNAVYEFMKARKAEEQPAGPVPKHGAPRGSNDVLAARLNTVIRN